MLQSTQDKLAALRQEMNKDAVDGFIILRTDEFGSEYLRPQNEQLQWLTGFTGSSGSAVVLSDMAVAMTDSRYAIQIKNQVDENLFEICDMISMGIGDWLLANCKDNAVIGYDPKHYKKKQLDQLAEKLAEKNITLKALSDNPIDRVWTDKPPEEIGIAELFPDEIAGATSAQKRQMIGEYLASEKINSCVLSLSDSICWLLNVRGADTPYYPLILSYAILHQDSSLDWYVDERKLPNFVKDALGSNVRIHAFETFADGVRGLTGAVQYDDVRSSAWIYNLLADAGVDIVLGKDPCVMPKACKTDAEQLAIKQAHIRDGVAVTRLLFWLEAQDLSLGHVTELLVEEKLEEFRNAHRTYRGQSFSTIAGWADHGAIVHYRATEETNKVITGNGFLLLDCGGQYEYGTTDLTRTIVLGDVTDDMKDRFSRVMKGHIAVARARFTPETTGAAIDNLARQPLIDEGLNFGHGTGHGVGCFMQVHEESTYISPRSQVPFRPGMLISNEPGYYQEGAYGIRHENLILCQEDEDTGDYYFETVSCVPFDKRGFDWNLINDDEKQWIEDYHRHVLDTLTPFLDEIELQWLQNTLFPAEPHEPTEEEVAFSYSAYD